MSSMTWKDVTDLAEINYSTVKCHNIEVMEIEIVRKPICDIVFCVMSF